MVMDNRFEYQKLDDGSINRIVDASVDDVNSRVFAFRKLMKFLSFDLVLKLCGKPMLQLHWPPPGDK